MAICVTCGAELTCGDKHAQPIGQTTMGCPLEKGALWVHVTDDQGKSLKGAGAELVGQGKQGTSNGKGLVVFEALDAGAFTVALGALTPPLSDTHDPPASSSRPATVRNGAIAYVPFILKRKARLRVEVLLAGALTPVLDCPLAITFVGPTKQPAPAPSDRGRLDCGPVSEGRYDVSAVFADLAQELFDLETATETVTLSPGEEGAARLVVKPRARLTVKVVKRSDHAVVITDCAVSVACAGPTPKTEATKAGVADLGLLSAGRYTLTATFVDAAQNRYDLALKNLPPVDLEPGVAKEVLIEVDPLYREVQFVGHCLLTIAEQVWVAPNWKSRYRGKDTEPLDITARVSFIRAVLTQARGLVDVREEVLKVFAIPECFFLGFQGAYSVEGTSSLISQLQTLVMPAEWKDWLFVFGTVLTYAEDSSFYESDWDALHNADPTAAKKVRKVCEVQNHALVIRGGFGDLSQAPAHTRLIPKATFSAELPKRGELHSTVAPGVFTEEAFGKGFVATEYEHAYGTLVGELLRNPEPTITVGGSAVPQSIADVVDGFGPPPVLNPGAAWADLKNTVRAAVNDVGMTRVVRALRQSAPETWVPSFKRLVETYAAQRPRPVDRRVLAAPVKPNYAPDDFTFRCARKPGPWLEPASGLAANRSLTFVLEICADHGEGRFKGAFTAQQRAIDDEVYALTQQQSASARRQEEIRNQAVQVGVQIELVDAQLKNQASLGAAEIGSLEGEKRNHEARVDALDEERRKEAAKERAIKAEIAKKKPTLLTAPREAVDVHLVPSAGMVLHKNFIASRPGGFAFNCDGWNVPSAMEGLVTGRACQKLEQTVAGPPDPLKLIPHTELIVAPGTSVAPSQRPVVTADGSELFSKGSGELHVYPPRPLPD